jgi:hypothetical protein
MRHALLKRNSDVSQSTELYASTKSSANHSRAEGLAEQNTDRAAVETMADHRTTAPKWSLSKINMGSSSQREMGTGVQAHAARREGSSTLPNLHRLKSFPHRSEIEGALGVQINGHAVVDPAACDRQHAIAFTEDRVVHFSSDKPSLLVAAHEAVHLAQHAGTTRDAGLGPEGHAGTVSHLVSRGQSVSGLIGSFGAIVPQAIRRYPESGSQTDKAVPSPALLNRVQIVDIIRRSRDISEVQAKLGFSLLTSPESLAKYFNEKGVTLADFDQMDEARHDRTPQKVMDEVLVPHDYQENRMVSVAVVGTAQQVAQRKAAGQEQARQIVLQGLTAAAGAQKGSASNTALSKIVVENRGGVVGTTGATPLVSGGVAPQAQAIPRAAPPSPVVTAAAKKPPQARAIPRAALPSPVVTVAAEKPPLLVQVEIKPVGGEGGGWRQLEQPSRSSYGAIGIITEGGGYEGVAAYDRLSGKVELKVNRIGEGRASAKTYQIGQFTAKELAELQQQSGGDTSRLGNLVEGPIRRMISRATGQEMLDPEKAASKTGVDWRPQQPPLPYVH